MKLSELFLKENVGGWDLFLRSAFGSMAIALLALGWLVPPWDIAAAVVAFVGLFSASTRHCTPYALLGISTKN